LVAVHPIKVATQVDQCGGEAVLVGGRVVDGEGAVYRDGFLVGGQCLLVPA
jgi:hypothetical protein